MREKRKKEMEVVGNGDTKAGESKQASRLKAYSSWSWDECDMVARHTDCLLSFNIN